VVTASGQAVSSPPGRYLQYQAVFTSAAGLVSPVLDEVTLRYEALLSHGLGLTPGWNLVSWPLAPVSRSVADTLASCSACDGAWSYDAWNDADPWKRWPGDLDQVDETMGLWLHATHPVTLTITGLRPRDPAIALRAGWNLVGYPSRTERPVAEALASIDGKYTLIGTFDSADTADPWKQYDVDVPAYANDLIKMKPGRGYWIYATMPCTLSIES
jgi:hypothetical protein